MVTLITLRPGLVEPVSSLTRLTLKIQTSLPAAPRTRSSRGRPCWPVRLHWLSSWQSRGRLRLRGLGCTRREADTALLLLLLPVILPSEDCQLEASWRFKFHHHWALLGSAGV